jgi:hypothetical protein
MIKTLQQASVAHGDLQHGNVFVVGEELRLVDYDGMYVPSLTGKTSHEIGHRNYQHPHRTERDFGPHLDTFSAWVIYASLIVPAIDSTLWHRFALATSVCSFVEMILLALNHLKCYSPSKDIVTETASAACHAFRFLCSYALSKIPVLDGTDIPRQSLGGENAGKG